MTSLLRTHKIEFQKVAAEVSLPEDPNSWSIEILQELYKQVPYVADFSPHVTMQRVDGERGYGLGSIEIANRTELPQSASKDSMDALGIKSVRIPVIIKDRKLQALDVIVCPDSTTLPLTESRLRRALFRPQAFDAASVAPGDTSMIAQLYPPMRQNTGFGGGNTVSVESMKTAGKGSLLASILPTINQSDFETFTDKLAEDSVSGTFRHNPAASASLHILCRYEPPNLQKRAAAAEMAMRDTVCQVVSNHNGTYVVKRANVHAWNPRTEVIGRGDAIRQYGNKVVLAADTSGSVTMANGMAEEGTTEADRPEVIARYGFYKVRDEKGRELLGVVFPNLIDLDGTAMPVALFTNGSQAAVQGEIAGIESGQPGTLFEGRPGGYGVFFRVLPNGRAEATIPIEVKGTLEDGAGLAVQGMTYDGRPARFVFAPHLKNVTGSDETTLLPSDMSWMPLSRADKVVLAESPEEYMHGQTEKAASECVYVRALDQNSFRLDGAAVEKLASGQRDFLDVDATMFLLSALGANQKTAAEALGMAVLRSAPIPVKVAHQLVLIDEVREQAKTAAIARLQEMRVPRAGDLVKEAAAIPDPTAVDTVLSLGFINPENVATFVSFLPQLEAAQGQMCQLLVASRLGLNDVPSGALERAVRSVELVIDGLKAMAFQS